MLSPDLGYVTLMDRLAAGGVALLDGGTGTELERRGVPMDAQAWCGTATAGHADVLRDVHRDYIEAGAEIIIANTFASSRLMLADAGLADQTVPINRLAVETALEARDGRSGVLVAGSLSHMIPVAPGSDRVRADGLPDDAAMADAFAELAGILKDGGVDLILLEMMYAPERVRLALDAARSTGLPVWLGLSARRDSEGRLLSFDRDQELPFSELVAGLDPSGVDAVGIMHTAVTLCDEALADIAAHWSGPRFAYPDSGHFLMPNWQFDHVISPAALCAAAAQWVADGAAAVGGCCGLSPEHIAALAPLKR